MTEATRTDDRTTGGFLVALASLHQFPSWLMSLILHLSLFTLLSLYVTNAPRGAAEQPSRTGGIVLAKVSGGGTNYLSEGDEPGAPGSATSATSGIAGTNPLPALDDQPLTSGPQLPRGDGGIGGVTGLPGDGPPGAGGLTKGTGGSGRRGIGDGSQAETSVFGVTGRGSKFVYVFDRSASMSGYEGRPLAAAKQELIASLDGLDKIHQFQIIFYNDKPLVMNVTPGQPPQLLFGDDQGKRLASTFIGGVVADGGTRHMEALLLALQMRPDVIFFLTDADEPKLTTADLRRIRERNRGVSINAIEFGSGPSQGQYTFLRQLADQNHGKHAYVDVTALPRP